MAKNKETIEICFDLNDPNYSKAIEIADQISRLKVKKEGKEISPFQVHLKTVPTLEKPQLDQWLRGYIHKIKLTPHERDAMEEPDEAALKVINRRNVHVNSNNIWISNWKNLCIILANEHGKIPEITRKMKWRRVNSADEATYNDVATQMSDPTATTEEGRRRQTIYKKQYFPVAFQRYIVVVPPAYKYPHKNTLIQGKRVWVMDEEFLRKQIGKCDPCGSQTQFMLCQKCGSKMQRVSICAKCKSPLAYNKEDQKFHCTNKKCRSALKKTSIRDKYKGFYACRDLACNTVMSPEKFAKDQRYMTCTNGACKSRVKHKKIAFLGKDLQFLDADVLKNELKRARK